MDVSQVANPQARQFLSLFLNDRDINHQFYSLVPEDKFNYHMVNTPQRKSDSPRESLAHQIRVQREYMRAIEAGELKFSVFYNQETELKKKSKDELLTELKGVDQQLITLLSSEENCHKIIKTPWSKDGINAITMLYALRDHEILHTGWNLALMGHLNIPRFPALQKIWG